MNKISIIIAREFNERVRKKSFIITTILMPVLMLALMAAPTLIMLFAKGETKHLLVIDDLGTELVTRYTQAEVYDLVNHRLNTGKPTIINTNLGLQEIERTYSSRVHSRLAGMYAVVQFKGQDIRLQKKQEGYR